MGAGPSVQASNAQAVSDVKSLYYNTSWSGGLIEGGTPDTFGGHSPHGQVTGAGATLGESAGASVFLGGSNTSLSGTINPFRWAHNLFYSPGCPS